MMRTLLLACSCFAIQAHAQYLVNDFDGNGGWEELPIAIDTASGNLWQIGVPQKTVFTEAHSPVHAIVTDTLAPCPPSNTSQFTVLMPTYGWGWWPEFFIHFQQKYDMDTAHAGGYMEISYDTGATWMNVFDDWVNPPVIQLYDEVGNTVQPQVLSNGQQGFTGRSGSDIAGPAWIWSSFCWVQTGIELPDTVRLRYTFYTDSLAAPTDGWMLDDFEYQVYIAHPISEYLKKEKYLVIAPNPMEDRLFISYDTQDALTPVKMDVVDLQGRVVRTLVDEAQRQGPHNLILWRKDLPEAAGVFLLHTRDGDRLHVERFEVLGR